MENTLFISNETFKVDWSIHAEWLEWILRTVVPAMRKSPDTQWVRLAKLMDLDEDDGPTYALQTGLATKADYDRFAAVELPLLMQEAYARWEGRFVEFRTLMALLDDGL